MTSKCGKNKKVAYEAIAECVTDILRIELRNLQILKEILEKSSQFLSSEQPCEPKSLEVALNIAGVEQIRSGNLRLRSTWRPFDSSSERKERY